jgi:hypothetical protein
LSEISPVKSFERNLHFLNISLLPVIGVINKASCCEAEEQNKNHHNSEKSTRFGWKNRNQKL